MKLSEYRDKAFAGEKKPCLATLKRMIDRKELGGEIWAGKYWVLVDDDCNAIPATAEMAAEQLASTGNALADSLMHDFLERHKAA